MAPNRHDALTLCENVYPIANGYAPVKSPQAVTAGLPGWKGGAAFTAASGTTYLLSGTSDGLYRYSGSAWVSAYAGASQRWGFSQNRSIVVAVNGGAPVAFDLTTGTAGLLGGAPPSARYTATVGNRTILAGVPDDVMTWHWSGPNNPELWDGNQPLPDGGKITGLSGGAFGLIFQRGSIYRIMDIGGDSVWQRDKISSEYGCIAGGSIVQAGAITYFLSERGFAKCDGNSVAPIGNEKVDRTFFNSHSNREALDNIWAATDPRHYLIYWAMPGNPGKVWCYNWMLDRWSQIVTPLIGLCSAFRSNVTTDALPDEVDDYPDLVDSAVYGGGEPRFYMVLPTGALSTVTGPNLAARLRTGFAELLPSRAARLNMARPMSDITAGCAVAVDARRRLGDGEARKVRSQLRASGNMPLRSEGRHHRISIETEAGAVWLYQQGISLNVTPGGWK